MSTRSFQRRLGLRFLLRNVGSFPRFSFPGKEGEWLPRDVLHSIPLSLKVGLVTMHSAKKEGWRYGVSNSQRDGSQGNVIYVRFWIIVTNARENPLTKIVRLFRVIMRNGISTLRVVFCMAVFFQAKLCRCIVRCERRTTFHIELRFQYLNRY